MASSTAVVKTGRIRRMAATLRNHRKKSALAAVLASYGVRHMVEKDAEFRKMTAYCREAEGYGDRSVGRLADPPYRVTVILNPASDGGKSRHKYENYCEPLLHLAGFKVSTVRTEGRGQAKDIVEKLDKSDAILVAGGDGTVVEAVTGLMRRPDAETVAGKVPLGILPVGKNNLTAKSLFPEISDDVELMAEASMSVIRGLSKKQDLIQVFCNGTTLAQWQRGGLFFPRNGSLIREKIIFLGYFSWRNRHDISTSKLRGLVAIHGPGGSHPDNPTLQNHPPSPCYPQGP